MVPMMLGFKLSSNMGTPYVDVLMYQKKVGKQIFFIQIKPNVSFAINQVSRFFDRIHFIWMFMEEINYWLCVFT
jgi:hypothetical protein